MVATFVLLYLRATYRTKFYSTFLFSPSLKFLLYGLFAGLVLMPIVSAFKADLCCALLTCNYLVIQSLTLGHSVTARPWAPSHQRVIVNEFVSGEFLVFLSHISVRLENFFNFTFGYLVPA